MVVFQIEFAMANVLFSHLLKLSFVIFTYVQCRKYGILDDQFLFFYEVKVTLIIWSLCFVLWIVFFVATIQFPHPAVRAARIIVLSIGTITPSLLSTAVIPIKVTRMNAGKEIRSKILRDLGSGNDSSTHVILFTALAN